MCYNHTIFFFPFLTLRRPNDKIKFLLQLDGKEYDDGCRRIGGLLVLERKEKEGEGKEGLGVAHTSGCPSPSPPLNYLVRLCAPPTMGPDVVIVLEHLATHAAATAAEF